MKKTNKGFTLIELLSAIVILALISLIVTPIVLKIIATANISSAKSSVVGIVKAAKNYYYSSLINETQIVDKKFRCDGIKCKLEEIDNQQYTGDDVQLEFAGIVPTNGTIKINDSGEIKIDNLLISMYKCDYHDKKVNCIPISDVLKIEWLDIPYKENMTYYFDYESNISDTIENYSSGDVPIKVVNALIDNNSIYFSGNNASYAYTQKNLSSDNKFTIYFVAKFDNVYSYNYMLSTLSTTSRDSFGFGIGRYGTGTNGNNTILPMVGQVNNNASTSFDILNYYVFTIVYNDGNVKFYIDGNMVHNNDNCHSSSTIYFASFNNNGKVYGGSLIRFKQFAFVDDVHTESQIKENVSWFSDKYLK